MSQPELEFFSTPPSSVSVNKTSESHETPITAIGNGTQELMDFWFNKSSQQLFSAVADFSEFMQKLSQELQMKGGVGQSLQISDLISCSQKMGTPEITEMLIKMNDENNNNNFISSHINSSQQNMISSPKKIEKIPDYSPNCDNCLLNNRSKDVPSILRRKKRLEKLDYGFMAENKDRQLEKYLNTMKYSQNNNETMILKYPEEREYRHQFDVDINRKRLRKSSVSSYQTSQYNSSETDNSNLSESDTKIDVDTKYTVIKSEFHECEEQLFDIPKEFKKNTPCENTPKNLDKTTGRRERNRLAAQKLREKKRYEKSSLEKQEHELRSENSRLKIQIEHLDLNIKIFRKIIQQYDYTNGR